MAIRYYDEALTNKISSWVKDKKLTILSPSDSTRLFQITADLNNDKPFTLPLIALSRDTDIEILSTNKQPLMYDGATIEDKGKSVMKLNAIPIKLGYQLDIYTRYFNEADEYVRNFIFNFINYPKLSIELPYNGSQIIHDSNVFIESTVSDNSDIKEKLIQGQFYRLTIKLTVDDAYLFSVPIEDKYKEISTFTEVNCECYI